MEQRGQLLGLPAARAELELAAAVRADAVLGAVVVGVAGPGRPPIRDGLRLTIRGGNGSASMSSIEWIGASQVIRSRWRPGSPSISGVTTSGSSIQASGNAVDHAAVQHRVGRLVDDRSLVEALEVDAVDRAGGDERRDQLVVQELVGSSLKRSDG